MRDTSIDKLTQSVQIKQQRMACKLKGDVEFIEQVVCGLLDNTVPNGKDIPVSVLLSDVPDDFAFSKQLTCLPLKAGKQLLGQEYTRLFIDLRYDFDANSICAALGTLVAGGFVFFLVEDEEFIYYQGSPIQDWLKATFSSVPEFAKTGLSNAPEPSVAEFDSNYAEQQTAIEQVTKVLSGHRKRPLLLTADRGRGKSTALGIAAANIVCEAEKRIIVTSSRFDSVTTLFEHAANVLDLAESRHLQAKGDIRYQAPDELLSNDHQCDLLIIDEASSIPVPMLKRLLGKYSRVALATTVFGYEGCGRGFSLKFQPWLKQHFPNAKFLSLTNPIRWGQGDYLEAWLNHTFLLDAEIAPLDANLTEGVELVECNKRELVKDVATLREVFALLVNAHYQTSPNDLIHLLKDTETRLWLAKSKDHILGCLLAVEEGQWSEELLQQVRSGARRPKGQLAVTTLVSQLAITEAAKSKSLRIMRIAVHPDVQQRGIGSALVQLLLESKQRGEVDFVTTSFGLSDNLLRFWKQNSFSPVHLATTIDKSTGCYSALCVSDSESWVKAARRMFNQRLHYLLPTHYGQLETCIVRNLLEVINASDEISCNPEPSQSEDIDDVFQLEKTNLLNYLQGGTQLESVIWFVYQRLMSGYSVGQASDLMLRKIVQNKSWPSCVNEFALTGKKYAQNQMRKDIAEWWVQ